MQEKKDPRHEGEIAYFTHNTRILLHLSFRQQTRAQIGKYTELDTFRKKLLETLLLFLPMSIAIIIIYFITDKHAMWLL